MAVTIIPTRGDIGAYFFKVALDDVIFELHFQYNDREQRWYMDLRSADGIPLRSGIKLIANYPLLRLLSSEARPAGEIVAINTVNDEVPQLKDLGGLVQLAYVGANAEG